MEIATPVYAGAGGVMQGGDLWLVISAKAGIHFDSLFVKAVKEETGFPLSRE
jgi:hypothetical protein